MQTRVGAGLALLALALLLPATAVAQAQEPSKDKMGQDHMAKDSTMMKDHMAKDSMAGHMAKDTAMMKDQMAKDGMMKDHMAKDAMMAPHGQFTGAAGHKVSGSYTIEEEKGKQQLELSADFSVEKAPDLYLVLSPEASVPAQGTVVLGELKKTSGAQYFTIPKGTDLTRYKYLVLWSKKNSATLATAALGASGDGMMMHN